MILHFVLIIASFLTAPRISVAVPSGGHSVKLTWTASTTSTPGILHYILRGGSSGNEDTVINTDGTTCAVGAPCTYTDTTVSGGSRYFYVVVAILPDGTQSTGSNEAAAVVPEAPPSGLVVTPN